MCIRDREPDYSNIPEISVPVTNPDLVRWMLLIAQLGQPATEEQKLIYKLYFRFLSIEMTKARFIIPTKTSEDFPEPDENGKTVLKKDMQISLPVSYTHLDVYKRQVYKIACGTGV